MPLYVFKCIALSHTFDHVCRIQDRDEEISCPYCLSFATRDVVASMQGQHSDNEEFFRPHLSEALGVQPGQIAEAKAKFPHHNFTPDGRMILNSPAEKKRALKDLGFVDYGNYHKDAKKHPKFGEMA